MKNFQKRTWLLIIASIVVSSIIIYSYLKQGIVYSLLQNDIDSFVEKIDAYKELAYLVYLLVVIVEVVVAPIPSILLYSAGGILFGGFLSGLIAVTGNVIGAYIAFMIARIFGRKYVEKNTDRKKLNKFDNFAKKYGGWTIFLLRINPFTSSDIVSYLAGLSKISTKQIIIGTALGIAPLAFFQAYFASDVMKNNDFFMLSFLIVTVVYMLLFFFGIFYLFKPQKKSENKSQNK